MTTCQSSRGGGGLRFRFGYCELGRSCRGEQIMLAGRCFVHILIALRPTQYITVFRGVASS